MCVVRWCLANWDLWSSVLASAFLPKFTAYNILRRALRGFEKQRWQPQRQRQEEEEDEEEKILEEEEEQQQQQLFPFWGSSNSTTRWTSTTLYEIAQQRYGGCTGTAYVKFGVPEDALLAVQTLCGNPLPDGSIMGVYVRQRVGAEHCSTTGHKTSGKKTLWMVAESWKPADGLNMSEPL